jgi:2-polyprenyl-6-hydroxyphenyl methylase/3-demethylubiquinone-9 3-methyltransferase
MPDSLAEAITTRQAAPVAAYDSGTLRSWTKSTEARELLALYRGASLARRLELKLRLRICPFEIVADHLPLEGRILDLGCGYGLLSHLLAMRSPERQVLGLDISAERVATSQDAGRGLANVAFRQGDVTLVEFGRPDSMVMNDLLHHIPHTHQIPLLAKCYEALPPEGVLIIKDVDKSVLWKYVWNYAHDFLKNRNLPFYCLDSPILSALLELVGFQVEITHLDDGYAYPHVLYHCVKA